MGKRSDKGRFAAGVAAVLCAVAVAFALQAPSPTTSRSTADVEAAGAPGASVASVSSECTVGDSLTQGLADESSWSVQEVSSDGTVVLQGEYDPDIVIALIGQDNDAKDLNEALSQLSCLDGAAFSITDADVQAGYVALPVTPGTSVADAVAAIDDVRGIVGAQPNYLYHLLDAESDGTQFSASDGGLLAGSVDTALLDALADVNDPEAKKSATETHNWHLKSISIYEAWDIAKGDNPAPLPTDPGDSLDTSGSPDSGDSTNQDGFGETTSPTDPTGPTDPSEPAASDSRVTVALFDTGYDLDHEDLTGGAENGIGGNVVAAFDATNNEIEHYDSGVGDIDGHGTHVAGIIAAIANNEKGTAGVSHNARILPVQVFHKYMSGAQEKNGASSLSVKAGYDYVCAHAEEYNIRVVNMSLGASQTTLSDADKLIVNAVDEAWAQGVLTVCSAGNGEGAVPYRVFPGDYLNHGMNVIALNSNRQKASYSNYNLDDVETYKDISAPGTGIYSTTFNGSYGKKSGTSMAAPIVSGVAALVFSMNSQFEPGDVVDILHATARDLTPGNTGDSNTSKGFDQYTGYGEVDAQIAVERASAYLMGDSTVLVGDALTLTPTEPPPTGEWSWESANPDIATVEDGEVTGVAGGTTTVTAISGSAVITKTVTVYDISYALYEDGVLAENLVQVDEVEIGAGETLFLWFNEKPDTGLWLIGSSNPDVMGTSVPGNDTLAIEGKAGGEAYVEALLKENPKLVVRMKVIVHDVDNPFALEAPRAVAEWPEGPWTYSGQAIKPEPVVKFMHNYRSNSYAETLVKDVDYTVEYANNVGFGTASATVVGKGRFAGSLPQYTFEIARADLGGASVVASGWKWDGAVHDPNVQVTFAQAPLAAEDNWSYEVHKGTADGVVAPVNSVLDVGEYTVVVTGEGNYKGTAITTFMVTEPDPVVPVEPSTPDQPDNPDQPDTPDTPTDPDKPDVPDQPDQPKDPVVPEQPDQTKDPVVPNQPDQPSRPDNPTDQGKSSSSDNPNPQPEKKPVSLASASVKLSQDSFVYDGTACTPGVTSVKLPNGLALSRDDYTVSYANNNEVGTATVTVTGKGNYTDAASSTFRITHRVSASSFSDFEAGAWYLRESPGEGAFTDEGDQRTLYLDYIVAKSIMSGYADGSGRFGVNDQMTRGQLVTMLYRAATGKTVKTTDNNVKPHFSDTPANVYYSAAVEWASRNNIVTGYNGTDRFGPDDPVTREQMATLMHRFVIYFGCDASPSANLTSYADWRNVSSWARSAMSYCVAVRAMGYGGTTLDPLGNATRTQAAKVVAVILHDVIR